MKLSFGKFRRAAVLVIGATALVLLAVSLAVRLYGNFRLSRTIARFDREIGSLELRDYMGAQMPRMDNASTWLEAGSGGIVLTRDDGRLISRLGARSEFRLEPAEREQAREILERSTPALELLHRAKDLEQSNYGIRYWNARDARLPPLLDLMHARDVLYLEGALALAEGRQDRALDAYETLASLAASLQRERFTIILVMGLHTERAQLQLARAMLTSATLDAAALDRLESRIPLNDLARTGRETLAADTASMIASMRHGSTGSWAGWWFQVSCGSLISAQILEGHRRFGERLSVSYPAYLEDKPDFDDLWLGRLFLYDMHATKGLLDAGESQRRLTRLAIELRRQRLTDGTYPEDLGGLPGGAVKDPLTASLPAYETRADGSARLELRNAGEMLTGLHPGDRAAQLFVFELPAG